MENDLFMSMMPTWQYQDTLMEINSSSSSDQSPANCLFIPFSDIWPENPLKFNSVTSSPVSPPPSVKTPTNDDSLIKEFDNSPKLGNIFMGLNSITPNFSGERSSGFGSKSFNGRTLNPYESPMAAQWSCLEGSSASNPESEKVNLKKRKTVRGKVKEVEDESNSRIAKQSENGSVKREENAEEKKPNDVKKPEPLQDYIHVRARRGQATDSHSLAERIRREKISDRMKMLQDIVPGCNKVTGKAVMLDEIINYVQSLQSQVEFLSMKLASVDCSSMGFNTEGIGSSIMKDVLEDTVHPPEKYCQENLPLNSSNTTVSHRLADPQQLLLSYENFIGDDLQTIVDLEFGQTALNPLSFHG